jgi:ABC-type Na+ efflux pump permease subunit
MHVVITIELTTIVSLIPVFQPMSMFFHMDSIRIFRNYIQSWRSTTIVIIIVGVRGVGDSKGEKNC